MKHPLLAVRLLSTLASTATRGQAVVRPVVSVDTGRYTILTYDATVMSAMYAKIDNARRATLTAAEVDAIEPLVDSSYDAYNKNNPGRGLFHPIEAYRRQYVAVINDKGEKEVWINCFYTDLETDWRHHVLDVDDGGVLFFQLEINLTLRKAYELSPGGSG